MKLQIICVMAAAILLGCSGSVKETSKDFNALPLAVQSTVRSQAPEAQIARIDSKTWNGRVVYRIKFKKPNRNPDLQIAEDGTLLAVGKQPTAVGATGALSETNFGILRGAAGSVQTNSGANAIPPSVDTKIPGAPEPGALISPAAQLSALPEAVQKTVKQQAPEAEVASIRRYEKNGHVFYAIKFKHKEHPTLHVAEDGSLAQGQ